MNATTMKTCANKECRQKEMPPTKEFFYNDAKSADGLSSWCIECQQARYKPKESQTGKFDRSEFMEDGQGRLVHINNVKEIDKTRDGLVRHLVRNALELQKKMIEFKEKAMSEIDAFVELSAMEYKVSLGGKKGNLTLYTYDMNYKVMIQISEYLVFDERLQVAKKMIDDCFTSWTTDSRSEIKTIINDAFSVNQEGKINTRRILALRRLEIADPLWQNAMQAISDSLQVAGSKSYMRIYKRIGQEKSWQVISLDMAAL